MKCWTYPEIAKKMGMSRAAVISKAAKMGLINPVYQARQKKHEHLKEPVMKYFLTHSFEQTQAKFGLSARQLKTLMNCAYRDVRFQHLRKDSRCKEPWTLKEMLFFIQATGLRRHAWIAKKLGRGTFNATKDRKRKWGISNSQFNGMPKTWARAFWPEAPLEGGVLSLAGPGARLKQFQVELIPWHDCLELAEKYPTPPEIKVCIRAMTRFQEMIYGTRSKSWIRRKINAVLKQK